MIILYIKHNIIIYKETGNKIITKFSQIILRKNIKLPQCHYQQQ